jgi:hypothetical protein
MCGSCPPLQKHPSTWRSVPSLKKTHSFANRRVAHVPKAWDSTTLSTCDRESRKYLMGDSNLRVEKPRRLRPGVESASPDPSGLVETDSTPLIGCYKGVWRGALLVRGRWPPGVRESSRWPPAPGLIQVPAAILRQDPRIERGWESAFGRGYIDLRWLVRNIHSTTRGTSRVQRRARETPGIWRGVRRVISLELPTRSRTGQPPASCAPQ